MKLLKIGSESGCDVVVDGELVSGHHADITVLNTGEIILEDKGSHAGTFVGAQRRRIKPGEEVPVYRGEIIRFADKVLDWTKIPMPDNDSAYRMVVNIGSNFRNDIVVGDVSVSPYHATLKIDKDGKVWLIDNKSENGTEVNGVRIAARRPVQIKKGDDVVIGDYDVSPQLHSYINRRARWIRNGLVAACCLLAISTAWFLYSLFGAEKAENAVVYVWHTYSYTATLKDNPDNIPLVRESESYVACGTAFFIDAEGRMGTGMSVAQPWLAEFSPEVYENIRSDWKEYLANNVPSEITTDEELEQFMSTPVGKAVAGQLADMSKADLLDRINGKLKRIHKSKVNITGKTHSLYIGYPGRVYEHADDLDRASVVAVSETTDKDMAILQLDTEVTPEKVSDCYFNINEAFTGKLVPMKELLIMAGYPYSVCADAVFTPAAKEPMVYESKVFKEPSRYTFELQGKDIKYCMCGAPVFTKRNVLVGIICTDYNNRPVNNMALQARYLKELYDKIVE